MIKLVNTSWIKRKKHINDVNIIFNLRRNTHERKRMLNQEQTTIKLLLFQEIFFISIEHLKVFDNDGIKFLKLV